MSINQYSLWSLKNPLVFIRKWHTVKKHNCAHIEKSFLSITINNINEKKITVPRNSFPGVYLLFS